MPLPFAKGHGLGNDYIVIRRRELPAPSAQQIRALCDRHTGIGSDGVLLLDDESTPFALRIFNPDGTEAEKSGNGLRIAGAFLHLHGRVSTGETFPVALSRDTVTMTVERELDDGALLIRVEMGVATFRGSDVGFVNGDREVVNRDLELPDGTIASINTVSLGNPHCVVFIDRLDREDFLRRAPQLCTHEDFAHGTNVQFARVIDDRNIEAWIWERGAGETRASGSSASAVAAAAVHNSLIPPGSITIHMQGGDARIEVFPSYDVVLTAPAVIVFQGELLHSIAAG